MTTTLPSRLVLLGHPVSHSLSPAIQNAALRKAGINLKYEALDVELSRFANCLDSLKQEGAAGNVTIPHKSAAAEQCDKLTSIAQLVGAVNTFWVENGKLVGDNTDVVGFNNAVHALLGRIPTDERVVLIGAGGSALAVAAAVSEWPGSTLTIYNRTHERAQELASRFNDNSKAEMIMERALENGTLIVNATPVGLFNELHPVDVNLLPEGAAVFDLVYKRGETAWVKSARKLGHRACDGLPMLIEQGAAAFERWLSVVPNKDAMWEAALS